MNRDRWLMLVLTGAMAGWWALGLGVTFRRSEPYPALMMPGFEGNGGYTSATFDRYRVAVESRRGRVETLHEPADLIVPSMGYVRGMRLYQRALNLDHGVSPPTVRQPGPDSVAWLLERVALREGVARDEVDQLRAVVLLDHYDVGRDPPLTGSRRVHESVIYGREEDR